MKKIFVMSLIFSFLLLTACDKESSTDDEYLSQESELTDYTDEDSAIDNTIVLNSESDIITTQQEDVTEIISENPFHYTFRFIDDEKILFFDAPIDGLYRFDMDTNDVKTNYKLKVIDPINRTIINTEYSTFQHGKTERLCQGIKYKIILSQDEGLPEATIRIGIPNEIKRVEDNTINGTLKYIGQEDTFLFCPYFSGIYRFNFDTTNVKCNYRFLLVDGINNSLITTEYQTYTNGAHKYLEAGKEYTITVAQNDGFVDYRIDIFEPQLPLNVSESFSGEICFIGQENVYYYIPPCTGTYKIGMSFGNKNGKCHLLLKDDRNQELISTSYEQPREVELEAEKQYTFVLSYGNSFMNYGVQIELLCEEQFIE